ncbi:MAG: stage III sporulation protein AG [Sporolactobacillus sp.]
MKQWMDRLKKWFMGEETEKENKKPISQSHRLMTRLLLLAAVGVLLLSIGKIFPNASPHEKAKSQSTFNTNDAKTLSDVKAKISSNSGTSIAKYESYASQSLKNILDQMQGVSDVSVMITFSSTEKKIYQNNVKTQENETLENDQKGGTRQVNERDQDSEVVMVDKDGVKEPVIVGKEQPDVRGVIVVAQGAEQPAIRAEIMEAVATVLNIPDYKVKVLQKSE